MKKPILTAASLRNELWNTLLDTKGKKIQPGQANAVAKQAREILRTVQLEIQVARLSNRKPTTGLIAFSG